MRQHDYTYWPRWDVISAIVKSYDFLYCLFIGFAIVLFFLVFFYVCCFSYTCSSKTDTHSSGTNTLELIFIGLK